MFLRGVYDMRRQIRKCPQNFHIFAPWRAMQNLIFHCEADQTAKPMKDYEGLHFVLCFNV